MTMVRIVLAGALAVACFGQAPKKGSSKVTRSSFGKLPDGRAVEALTLSNAGMQAKIMTYGAAVVSLTAPDKNGKYADIVLGMDGIDGYVKGVPYFGAIVGRYGNRIGKAHSSWTGRRTSWRSTMARTPCTAALKGFDKTDLDGKEARTAAGRVHVRQQGRGRRAFRAL